jgi:hypothetical protein
MGITNFSVSLLEKAVEQYRPKTVIELGSQNLYTTIEVNPPFADTWYRSNGFEEYACIDLAGDNGAITWDLSRPLPRFMEYDLVTDFGTSEHCVQMEVFESVAFHGGHINSIYPVEIKDIEEGYYNCWLNKFNLCKTGGYIISENPKTGHWPEHGYTYVDFNTYWQLSRVSGLYIVEIGEHPASGNTTDGYNIWCIMKKVENHFPDFATFKEKVQVYSK